jgi:putative transposase
MKARYQYRFYPTDQQQQSLAQLFGCVRVVWNDALAMCKQAEKLPGFNKLSALLTQTKKTIERSWLADVSAVPLQQSLRNLDVAYRNFFNSRNGKRKGGKMGIPKFKKKTNKQSAEFTKAAFSIDGKNVYLAKIGDLQPICSRELPNVPSSVTVIKDCANRYFLSFVVEIDPIYTEAKNQSIGVDLGIKTFAVMSNGEKAFSPDYSNTDRKIRKLQRKLARQQRCALVGFPDVKSGLLRSGNPTMEARQDNAPKQKESKRRKLTRVRIAKLHNKTADTRKDFLHKLSTKLVSENQTIVLEDLNVAGMVKNRKLSRAISQQGWGEFRSLCEAKCEKFGRTFNAINRWAPTSQVCSSCGFRWGKIDLSVRSVVCLNCHAEHDRDENASKNIEMVGTGNWHDLKWTGSDSKTTSVANCDEPSRILTPSG